MAKLVSDHIEKAIVVVDNLFCELDGGVMFVGSHTSAIELADICRFSTPVGSARGGVQSPAPDEAYSSS